MSSPEVVNMATMRNNEIKRNYVDIAIKKRKVVPAPN
jgi:hypothetical protein